MASCPCCSVAEEPRAVPQQLSNAPAALTPADQLWCTRRDEAVRLRMEGSGPASNTPITTHQMFVETVESFGDHPALAYKVDGQWVTMNFKEYYQQCRAAAKSFLRVSDALHVRSVKSVKWTFSPRKAAADFHAARSLVVSRPRLNSVKQMVEKVKVNQAEDNSAQTKWARIINRS